MLLDRIPFGKRALARRHGRAPQTPVIGAPAAVSAASVPAPLSLFDWRVIVLLIGMLLTLAWAAAWAWIACRLVIAII
jgi:hypothetical protein